MGLVWILLLTGCQKNDGYPPPVNESADADTDADSDTDADTDADTDTDNSCPQVVVSFSGQVTTVSGGPLGLDSGVVNSTIDGSFGYDPCVIDGDPDNTRRGSYDHRGSGSFTLNVGGKSVSGSGSPIVTVEDFDPDTFRYQDGPQIGDPTDRSMFVGGVAASGLTLTLAITDAAGTAFDDDNLPASFPMLDIASYPHTFALDDSGGGLLIQLDSASR